MSIENVPNNDFGYIFVVHGGWSVWGNYGSCSQSCGGGTKYRSRSCNAPSPQHGGNACSGSSSQSTTCNSITCLGKKMYQ